MWKGEDGSSKRQTSVLRLGMIELNLKPFLVFFYEVVSVGGHKSLKRGMALRKKKKGKKNGSRETFWSIASNV